MDAQIFLSSHRSSYRLLIEYISLESPVRAKRPRACARTSVTAVFTSPTFGFTPREGGGAALSEHEYLLRETSLFSKSRLQESLCVVRTYRGIINDAAHAPRGSVIAVLLVKRTQGPPALREPAYCGIAINSRAFLGLPGRT